MRKRFYLLTWFVLMMAFAGLSMAETAYSAQTYSAQTSSGAESDGTNPNNSDLSAEDVAWLAQVYGISQGEVTSLPSVYSTSTENGVYLPKTGQTESETVQTQQSADAAGMTPALPQTNGTAGMTPAFPQTGGTAGGTAVSPQTGGTAGGTAVSPQTGGTAGGTVISPQTNGTAGMNAAFPQTGGTAGGTAVSPQTNGTAGMNAAPLQTNGTAANAGSVAGMTEGLNTIQGGQGAGSVMVPVMGAFLDGTVLNVGAEITIGLSDRSTIAVSPEICSVVSGGTIGYGFACRVFYERVKQDTNTYVDRFTQVLVYPQLINAGAKATPAPEKKSSDSGSAGSRSTNDAVSGYPVDVYENPAQTAEDDSFGEDIWNETDDDSETAWDSEVYPDADSEAYWEEGND
jgi:hypothetical protein